MSVGVEQLDRAEEAREDEQKSVQRGRPVIKRVDLMNPEKLRKLIEDGDLWMFCGEYDERSEVAAIDEADRQHGGGIFQAFERGAWGRGHWRA